jgi:hypothetical protein
MLKDTAVHAGGTTPGSGGQHVSLQEGTTLSASVSRFLIPTEARD